MSAIRATAITPITETNPLKALANDIRKNLLEPLAELRALGVPEITTAVRTGDTSQSDRQRMAKSPPHVLVTTPEYLHSTGVFGVWSLPDRSTASSAPRPISS